MSRVSRTDVGDYVYHVINRANSRLAIFKKEQDYQAFEQVLTEAQEKFKMRLLAYCLMPNHWHLVLYPRSNGDLSKFTGWLTLTHTQRYHAAHHSIGSGHLYQGRYKSFLVEKDEYFLGLCRYVEQNPLRARLTTFAQDWPWSSLWRREKGTKKHQEILSPWPIMRPKDYVRMVNELSPKGQLEAIRSCIQRGNPYGSGSWSDRMIRTFGLEITVRRRGRPKKGS